MTHFTKMFQIEVGECQINTKWKNDLRCNKLKYLLTDKSPYLTKPIGSNIVQNMTVNIKTLVK